MKQTLSVPVPLSSSSVDDAFWGHFRLLIRDSVLPYQWEALNDRLPDAEPSHSIQNFRVAALRNGKLTPTPQEADTLRDAVHMGCPWQDTDLYKWLEAAAYIIESGDDDGMLAAQCDQAVALIAAAQLPDGYLDTYYSIDNIGERYTNLRDRHELYCAGHFIEAAVAYTQATGKTEALETARRLADHLKNTFGLGEGQIAGYPGHEELELALVRLWECTGEKRYLELAAYFVNQRGVQPLYFDVEAEKRGETGCGSTESLYGGNSYYQADKPIREMPEVKGHAVRAGYYLTAVCAIAQCQEDASLHAATNRLWRNLTMRRMYITGGVGDCSIGEMITADFRLPNDTAYSETCAAIALGFVAHRMLREAKGEYGDVLERVLYNGALAGISLDGQRFFYVNPLEVVPDTISCDPQLRHVKPQRQPWFDCACCPPNLARLYANLGRYAWMQADNTLYVHLHIGGRVEAQLETGVLALEQTSKFPWQGDVGFHITQAPDRACTIAIRRPGWCPHVNITLNDTPIMPEMRDGYMYFTRVWQVDDRLAIGFAMITQRQWARPEVISDFGSVALQRGPLIYCVEEADNGAGLAQCMLPRDGFLQPVWQPELLGGIMTIVADGLRQPLLSDEAPLYSSVPPQEPAACKLVFVPYYAWNNRGVGEMRVFLRDVD